MSSSRTSPMNDPRGYFWRRPSRKSRSGSRTDRRYSSTRWVTCVGRKRMRCILECHSSKPFCMHSTIGRVIWKGAFCTHSTTGRVNWRTAFCMHSTIGRYIWLRACCTPARSSGSLRSTATRPFGKYSRLVSLAWWSASACEGVPTVSAVTCSSFPIAGDRLGWRCGRLCSTNGRPPFVQRRG
jgi:hypothetical protein